MRVDQLVINNVTADEFRMIADAIEGKFDALKTENEELKRKISEYESLLDSVTRPTSIIDCPTPIVDYVALQDIAKEAGASVASVVYHINKYHGPKVIKIKNRRSVTAAQWAEFTLKHPFGNIAKRDKNYSAWAKEMRTMCTEKGLDSARCFAEAFKRLNHIYGIVWCDEIKRTHSDPRINKLKLCYYIDTRVTTVNLFRNTLDSVINDMVS